MIPIPHINRRASGAYEVTTTNPDLHRPETFSSVSAALKFAGDDMPRDFALCAVADELMELTARVHAAEDELDALARAKAAGRSEAAP